MQIAVSSLGALSLTWLLFVCGTAEARDSTQQATPPASDKENKPTPDAQDNKPDPHAPTATRRALAIGASLVPGAVIHGSGSWVLGDDDAAERLLILEGIGLGLAFGGLGGLAATGANRTLSGPLIATTAAGVSLFTLTLLADIYRVTAPANGFGVPRRTPLFESNLGYLYVNDPTFSHHHFSWQGLRFQRDPFGVRVEALHAPGQGNARLRVQPSFRLWQADSDPSAPADGSFVDASFAGTLHEFDEDGFSTTTYDLLVEQRLDTTRVVPTLRGAFAEFSVGYAIRSTYFHDFAVQSYDSLLLGGFGFGVYLGSATGAGGETVLYYDHRHDDFAAGMKATGLGSGVAGHVGWKAHYYFDEHWGLGGLAEVGSAWVLGLSMRARAGARR